MKRFIKIMCAILALVCIGASCVGCVSKTEKEEIKRTIALAEESDPSEVKVFINSLSTDHFKKSKSETNYVMIEVQGYGKMVIALRPDIAPITVVNFKQLVSEGFYDGLIFHRIIKNFMVQGGGYKKDFSHKDSPSIKGEFESNGFENDLLHVRGVISMARLGNDNDSASSQFFIMHKDTPDLDGDYASFGYVIAGLSVVDKIASVETYSSDYPVNAVVIKKAYFVKPITG